MALAFFAAVSRRVDLLRRETDAAKAAALVAQTRAAERLEAEVAERTRDLRTAKDRAERADRAKGELLARVSHELRTPLQAILGYAHLLLRDAPAQSGPAPERLALLAQSGRHLAGLIDDLLEYARGERGGITPDPRAAYLHHLVHRLAQQGALLAARHGNRWRCRVGRRLPAVVRMDARRLEQAVLVLLSNAARYTRGGGILLAVRAEPARSGGVRLRFTVSDTGPGIAAADLERIFEPFERAPCAGADGIETDDAAPGLGLGLPIARQIARTMAGDVAVQSRPGRGSRFQLWVTLALADEAEVPALLPDLRVQGYAGPRRRLLVVEDHPANRCWLEQLLAELGFTVHAVGSVAEAHAVLAQQAIDLAVLDQRLPDGSAWDILPSLRDAPSGQTIPAVLLSALPATPPADRSTAPGFDATLLKPVDASELLPVMARLLALEWITAPPRPRAAADGPQGSATARDDTPATADAAPTAVLSDAERDAIADLARAGAVYELEDWIVRLRERGTGWQHLTRQLDERLSALDFEAIAAMAADAAS
jgi:signal transduction histidine kinase/DNA-binding NarL/FixJ family response regulator